MAVLCSLELRFINGGKPLLWVPEIPIWLSLLFIAASIVVATVASLMKTKGGENEDGHGLIHNKPVAITADSRNEESEVDKKAVRTATSK